MRVWSLEMLPWVTKFMLLYLLFPIIFLKAIVAANSANSGILPEALDGANKVVNIFPHPPPHPNVHISGYIKAAEMFRNSINETVDPCVDFYEFSCGNWIANNPIPSDLTSFSHFNALRENVNQRMKDLYSDNSTSNSKSINILKRLYNACMNVDELNSRGTKHFLKRLEGFGYWPIIHGDKWKEHGFDISTLLISIFKSRGLDILVDIHVGHDQKNVKRKLLHFDMGDLGLGASARDYYLNVTHHSKELLAYRKYLRSIAMLLAKDSKSGQSSEQIDTDIEDVINLETRLAKIMVPHELRRNFTRMYNVYRFNEISTIFNQSFSESKHINWHKILPNLMPEDMHYYLDGNPEVIVTETNYFQKLPWLLRTTTKRTITNYILLRYVMAFVHQLDERFEDIVQVYLKELTGKEERSPRWKDCSSLSSGRMIYASSALYVRKYFLDEDLKSAKEMIKNLRQTFVEMLKNTEWMRSVTHDYALRKVSMMSEFIGYPQFVTNDTKLDQHYENLTISENTDYIQMLDELNLFSLNTAFRKLSKPIDPNEFITNANSVNAFYSSVRNSITFPAGILQAPFFDSSFPDSVNYGAIGSVIGHEITHGFDDQGGQFDAHGNLYNWWDKITQANFIRQKQCIIDQYGSYKLPQINLKIDGILTQGENIADNGGVRQAFAAYRKVINEFENEPLRLPGMEKYSHDQLFFMSWAQAWCSNMKPQALKRLVLLDPHSPSRFRVNGVVANQPEFAKAFKCPTNSPMNPIKKCSVW